ncbi:glycosyltransferase family 2 protein [Mesorhizobium sp. VNQ89]|uniref:glycosyltransferase family 2 protein n=1 Tax=Mesorhizobium quangtriensis TaxID=3157709 RepID=UPI0032B834AC
MSVVIATHNRPAALREAIKSVVAQTLTDWEVVVVGDCCEPDTPATIAEFGDPRIHYVDLPINFGEQSGPNNLGIAKSRGRYVSFLNHDDLWFPDHLASLCAWIEATGADLAFARAAVMEPRPAGELQYRTTILGGGRRGRYDPASTLAWASTILVRRSSADLMGPWRAGSELIAASSQDWLFRAWRKGLVLASMPHLTVLLIQSGSRQGSYLANQADEQAALFRHMHADADALRLLLLESASEPKPSSTLRYWKRRFYAACGIHPDARSFRRNFGPGDFIQKLRRIRGLEASPIREPGVDDLRDRYRKKVCRTSVAKD